MKKILTLLVLSSLLAPTGSIKANADTAFKPGDVLKGSGSTVYYYATNGKRYVFPNEKTYRTWYWDYSGVKTVPDSLLNDSPLGGNVTYKPGMRLIKTPSVPKVYAVLQGGALRWIETEAVAKALYGDDWKTYVDDVPEGFFTNYTIGENVSKAADYDIVHEIQSTVLVGQDKKADTVHMLTYQLTGTTPVSVGDFVAFTVSDPGDGGYQFDPITVSSPSILSLFSNSRTINQWANEPIAGDFGAEVWVYKVEQAGQVEINLTASQSWRPTAPLTMFHATLTATFGNGNQ